MSEILLDYELLAIRDLASDLARTWVKMRLSDDCRNRNPQIIWTMMQGALHCSLRMSQSGAVWINVSTFATRHNFVSSKPGCRSGVVIQSRFDATDFVEWLFEELSEAMIRMHILSRLNAKRRDNLLDIVIERARKRSNEYNGNYGLVLGASREITL